MFQACIAAAARNWHIQEQAIPFVVAAATFNPFKARAFVRDGAICHAGFHALGFDRPDGRSVGISDALRILATPLPKNVVIGGLRCRAGFERAHALAVPVDPSDFGCV